MLRNKIVLELNDKYTDINSLKKATMNELLKQGYSCEISDSDSTIFINKEKYSIKEKLVKRSFFVVQRVILTKIK